MTPLEEREASLLKVGVVQMLLVALLVVALIHHQNHLILLLLTLLVFIFGARFWSRLGVRGLSVRVSINRMRVFPGEVVRLSIHAENRKVLPVWLRLHLRLPPALSVDTCPGGERDAGLKPCSHQEMAEITEEQGLLWYQSLSIARDLWPQQRGIHRLGSPQLVAGDLMGLYPRMVGHCGESPELIVYPRLVPLAPFPLVRRLLFGHPGGKSSVVDPIYLLGTRDYQAGSPSRFIHWIASARLNRLQERVFEPSRQARLLFLLDVAPFAAAKAEHLFEQAVEALASLAVECRRRGFAVGLVSNGVVAGDRLPLVAPARKSGQVILLLEILAGLSLRPGQDLAVNLQQMTGLDSGLCCILFALDADQAKSQAMVRLRRKNIPLTTIYCRRAEQSVGDDHPDSRLIALHRLLRKEAGPL